MGSSGGSLPEKGWVSICLGVAVTVGTNPWDLEAFFSGKRTTNSENCSCVGENII